MLEQKPLANAVSPTVLQSNGIHSLLTPVTIQSCHGLRTALKTRLYKQYYKPDLSITSRISVLQAGSQYYKPDLLSVRYGATEMTTIIIIHTLWMPTHLKANLVLTVDRSCVKT